MLLAGDIETNPGPGRETLDTLDCGVAVGTEERLDSSRALLDTVNGESESNSVGIIVGVEERLDFNGDSLDTVRGTETTLDGDIVGLEERLDSSSGDTSDIVRGTTVDNNGSTSGGRDSCQSESVLSGGEMGQKIQSDVMIRVTCISCNSLFRKQYSPFFCVEPGCLAVCHRQEMCSGLSRTEQKREGWRCYLHGGRDLRREVDDTRQEPESLGKCTECDKTLKAGMSPIICSNCPNLSHASCTKLTRDEITKKRKGLVNWICTVCSDQGNDNPSSANRPVLEKSSCCKCKKAICRGVERMCCNKCSKESHKGCTGLTRDAYQSLHENNAWTCEKCDYSPPPHQGLIPFPLFNLKMELDPREQDPREI